MIFSIQILMPKYVRQPGVEPGSLAWEARMITATLLALRFFEKGKLRFIFVYP